MPAAAPELPQAEDALLARRYPALNLASRQADPHCESKAAPGPRGGPNDEGASLNQEVADDLQSCLKRTLGAIWDFLGFETAKASSGWIPTEEATLQVTTKLSGSEDQLVLSLWCSRETAARLTGAMIGLPVSELVEEDIHDALGEIANMLGGNLKAIVERYELQFPVVSPKPTVGAEEVLCSLVSYPEDRPVGLRLSRRLAQGRAEEALATLAEEGR
jgi:hypothetical protein